MSKPNLPLFLGPAQKWILIGMPVLILLGFPMHYIYEWSRNSPIIGAVAPVNESIWEHLKLTFWPMLLWWMAGYFVLQRSPSFNTRNWIVVSAVAEFACPLAITSFYYLYTGSLGIESLALDIFSLFLGVILAQCVALHIYSHVKCDFACVIASLAVLILMVIMYTIFTFNPPNIPLFQDSMTKKYGI